MLTLLSDHLQLVMSGSRSANNQTTHNFLTLEGSNIPDTDYKFTVYFKNYVVNL